MAASDFFSLIVTFMLLTVKPLFTYNFGISYLILKLDFSSLTIQFDFLKTKLSQIL